MKTPGWVEYIKSNCDLLTILLEVIAMKPDKAKYYYVAPNDNRKHTQLMIKSS